MARRRIGQEALRLGVAEAKRSLGALDDIAGLIDWLEIDQELSPIYRSTTGEKAWPPLAMLKALLLSVWYDLSDVKLAEALDDRGSFRRFCGFAASELTPERTAFVRFRRELLRHSLDTVLFEAVTRQLDEKNVKVKTGTLVDATIIASASIRRDEEARWVGHRRKAAVHGYKAHVATDADGGIVRRIEMTPANVNDGRSICRNCFMVRLLLAGIPNPSRKGIRMPEVLTLDRRYEVARNGRRWIGTVAGFTSEWWPTSNPNGGRHRVGIRT